VRSNEVVLSASTEATSRVQLASVVSFGILLSTTAPPMLASFFVANQHNHTPSKRGYKQRNRDKTQFVRVCSSMSERPFVNRVEIHADSQAVRWDYLKLINLTAYATGYAKNGWNT